MFKKVSPTTAAKVPAAVDGRIMHSDPRMETILLTIQAGEEIPMHQNPFDVLFAGIDGKATLISPDVTETIEAGETIFVAANQDRAWKNYTKQPARIIVIKLLKDF